MVSALFADFVNSHDVRMPQRGDHLRFIAKPPHKIRAGKRAVQKHFQRDDAVQAQLPRPINHAHAAARNLFQQVVIAQPQQHPLIQNAGFRKKSQPPQTFQAQPVNGVSEHL